MKKNKKLGKAIMDSERRKAGRKKPILIKKKPLRLRFFNDID